MSQILLQFDAISIRNSLNNLYNSILKKHTIKLRLSNSKQSLKLQSILLL